MTGRNSIAKADALQLKGGYQYKKFLLCRILLLKFSLRFGYSVPAVFIGIVFNKYSLCFTIKSC